MSASPAGAASGPGRTPNGAGHPPPFRRRPPPKVNPLNPRHKPSKQIQRPKPPTVHTNRDQAIPVGMPAKPLTEPASSIADSQPPRQILPVIATKRELMNGLRFHVARLISKDVVDVTDSNEYMRPVKLHRKDPRFKPNGEAMQLDSKEELVDDKERERLEAAKAERQRVREEQQKQMAPGAATKKKPQAFKKKVEQVYRADDTPEARKRAQLRYEEALPWHLEDFEDKHVWQGAYEAALSECNVILVGSGQNFRLVPLEKWYRFRPKATTKERVDVDTAEKAMAKGARAPRWLVKNEQQERKLKLEEKRWNNAGFFSRSGEREDKGGADAMDFGDQPEVDPDANDIDFNLEEEFADDEENELFEGDDDTKKVAEERVKREQFGANVFDLNDEKAVDAEAEREKMLAEVKKRLEKGTRKALLKREKNFNYESDSEGNNPYSSESESEDSELERQKEEESKREEEQKVKQDPKSKNKERDSTKPPSGASSKGANTPSGRKEKHQDALRKTAALSHKRPGSPNLSETSGNESSRKRVKNNQGAVTPRPGPDSLPRKDASRQGSFIGVAGSGSDTDSRAGNPRLRLKMSGASPGHSPRGSRAGSPIASGHVSRAGSPPGGTRAGSPAGSQPQSLPTAEEIRKYIPKEGIALKKLSNMFKARVGQGQQSLFIAEVKKVARMEKGENGEGVLLPRNVA